LPAGAGDLHAAAASVPQPRTNRQLACQAEPPVTYEPYVLFFGRLERYKGIDTLLAAWLQNETYFAGQERFNLVLAGPGQLSAIWNVDLPAGVILRNRLIEDAEALDLFRRCSLVILPYVKATQSALVAAAYYFRKPVMVTYNGALPEYVEEGRTGFVVQPDHPPSLARALRTALADRERLVDMGQAGRAWYDRERERETAALLNLYRHSLGGRVHGAAVTGKCQKEERMSSWDEMKRAPTKATAGWTAPERIALPSLRLRVSERRLLLVVVDMALLSGALLLSLLLRTNLGPQIAVWWSAVNGLEPWLWPGCCLPSFSMSMTWPGRPA
jgi:hypothetical protein